MINGGIKTAGSIRRGFEYQDLMALRLALELYGENKNFKIYLEYGKPGGLDDIVIILDDEVNAYQIKHAEDPFDVYKFRDFTEKTIKNVCFRPFSDSWSNLRKNYPKTKIACRLLSNRSLDSNFRGIVTKQGGFTPKFIEGRIREERGKFWKDLNKICGLDNRSFKKFLSSFYFDLNQRDIVELRDYIKGSLLDHRLGISEPNVFLELQSQISQYAQNSNEPISSDFFNRFLRNVESRYILPQRFDVDTSSFVRISSFYNALDCQLAAADGEYVVVTGLPGSGKSTSLTAYLDALKDDDRYICIKYYCFININDNQQKQRLEAQSLRVNILSELQKHFSDILDRRFDFSEKNFNEVLERLGKYFSDNGKKLVLLLDGLDHAERQINVLHDVLTALPHQVPKGIVFLIGTQELRYWKPLALKRGREDRHLKMPLFSMEETQAFFAGHKISLTDEQLQLIQNKSEGLPLYLVYVAQGLRQTGKLFDLKTHPAAKDGYIHTYYESLWDNFDSSGMGKAKYLCEVAACLNFKVHVNEFIEFQEELGLSDFDEAFRTIKYLLRIDDNMMSLFHDSFRLFVNSTMPDSVRRQIVKKIYEKLRGEERKDRWYRYGLEYAFNAGDHDYILNKVNKQFVNDALIDLRADGEVMGAIDWAIESAKALGDLVAIARLGSLHFRTHERLESLDRALLGKALMHLDRKNEVVAFSYEPGNNRWLVSRDIALELIVWCAKTGNIDIGKKLFAAFLETLRNNDSPQRQDVIQEKHDVIQIAKCLAIYGRHRIQHLRWLSSFKFKRDPVLGNIDYFTPSYNPHLDAYIRAAIEFRDESFWRRIIRVGKVFDNKAVRYFAIRSLARCGSKEQLASEITEYLDKYPDTKNLELAFYAAQAGLSPLLVSKFAGLIRTPQMSAPELEKRQNYETELRKCLLTAVVTSYEGAERALQEIHSKLAQENSFWGGVVKFIILAGGLLGKVYRGEEQGLVNSACEAINQLEVVEQAEGERIVDTLDAIRTLLPDILFNLTFLIALKKNSQLVKWEQKLLSLRQSSIWQIHYGINETVRDYSFELTIWERLSDIAAFRAHIASIVVACENEYRVATTIKGGSRSYHFLGLANIAAKCGLRSVAERCIQAGVEATNIYGYRKDATLSRLIDVLELLNQHRPQKALSRCSDILEMTKWMSNVTDGSGTLRFSTEVFSLVLRTNRAVALDLIKYCFQHCPRWMTLDCLEEYICSSEQSDPEFLWALCEVFSSHTTEPGRHSLQILRARQYVKEMGEKSLCQADVWDKRFDLFIRLHLSPRYWPKELQQKHGFQPEPGDGESSHTSHSPRTIVLDGVKRTTEEIGAECAKSFDLFLATISKLRAENEHFWEYDLTNQMLLQHIANARTLQELVRIKEYVKEEGSRVGPDVSRTMAIRFSELGDEKMACEAWEIAISSNTSWHPHKASRKDLEAISRYSQTRIREMVMQKCYDDLQTSYGGFNVPALVATALDIIGDIDGLEQVFNDYLCHCQELFAHLPKTPMYAWLNDDCAGVKDECSEICHLLIEELEIDEVDLGNRLVQALVALTLCRAEIVWPIIISHLRKASGLRRSRLLNIIQGITWANPTFVRRDWRVIYKLADVANLQQRLLIARLLEEVFADKKMPALLRRQIDRDKRKLSSTIYVSTYRLLHTSPSTEFVEFVKKATLTDFHRQLEGITDVLRVDNSSVLADLERRLKKSGWNLSDAKKQRSEDWEYHVHPQGWPVVWIFPRFHTRICLLLYEVIGEYAENMKFKDRQLESVWRIIQPSDPEYQTYTLLPKPQEVPFLAIKNKTAWFQDLSTRDSLQNRHMPEDGWLTLFESYRLSQDKKFEVPFVSYMVTFSSFVKPELTLEDKQIQVHAKWKKDILFCHPYESMTWEQARTILTRPTGNFEEPTSLPAISVKENPVLFLGFRYIASLPSWLIRDFDLVFRGTDLFKGKEQVSRFECWQGGYIDEAYSRELLSEGTRVLVRVDFLKKVLDSLNMRLCRKLTEKRTYYDSIHHQAPDEEISKTVIEVF